MEKFTGFLELAKLKSRGGIMWMMKLPEKSLSEIAKGILSFDYFNPNYSTIEWEDFILHCSAWEERTGESITFAEYDKIQKVYGTK